jgi:hypothetical protein
MSDGLDSLGRVRAQAIVLLVLAFLAGAFAGGAIEHIGLRTSRGARPARGFLRGPGSGQPRAPGSRGPGGFTAYFDSIGLSADQRTKIDEIVKKRSARVDSVRKSSWDVVSAARDSTRKEVDAVLTADQRRKLDSLRPRGGRGGFGPPGSRGPRGGAPGAAAKRP